MDLSEQVLQEGDLSVSLTKLQEKVRNNPSDYKDRVFLFQLLSVMGQWDRALTQLKVAGELDASTLMMVQTYREALRCEVFRVGVFNGKRQPMIFGEPEQWIALLIEALSLTTQGQIEKSQTVRNQAFELAPTSSGQIDGQEFEWIADADLRIGPVLECILNGRYYWIPFNRISELNIESPTDLRDEVWTPAYFTWVNGGQSVGLIPTRYPNSENSNDTQILRSKRTDWESQGEELYFGLGQRMLVTDLGEYPIMDIRCIKFNTSNSSDIQSPETITSN